MDLLAADIVFYGDGGAKASAVFKPIYGRERVGPFVHGQFEQAHRLAVSVQPILVNGQPGAVTYDSEGKIINVLSVDLDGVVQTIRSVVNPDMWTHLGAVSDVTPPALNGRQV
jgi:RNA polymerase sigma-70 factor (ECF subfamily)